MADNILRVNEMLKLSEQEYYQGLKQLLAIPPSAKYIDVEQQYNGQNLLTANNTIRKSLYKITDENLRQELISRAEQLQLNAKINILEKNLIIFRAFIASYKYYQQENSKTNHLDYNDIIALCQELFSGHDLGWVGFKLNQQISHILLDEAQDTSPKQWQIIDKLYGFAYETISDASSVIEQQTLLPTLFIVGDYKQSIYSFQGAKPEYYQSRLAHFQQAYPLVNWHVEQLDQCYRCPKQILDFCNQLFLESNKQITSYRPHTSQSAIIGNVREVNITKEQYDNDNLLELIAVDLTQPTFILAKKWATAHDVYNEDEVDVYQLRNAMLMNHRLDSLGRFIKDVFLSASNNCYDADLEQRVILRKKFLLSQALQSNQHYKKYIADNYSKKYPAPFNNNIISMTMHGAKGLERQNVYVILQAKAKAQPNAMLIDEVNNIYVNREGKEFIPYITDLTMMEKTQAKAEDNRLLYVALTRSKQNLTVVNITN
jgi:ATP-dependent exoDNAse (exonuclease V) beta subunit